MLTPYICYWNFVIYNWLFGCIVNCPEPIQSSKLLAIVQRASTFPGDPKKLKKRFWDKEDTKSDQSIDYKTGYKKLAFTTHSQKVRDIKRLYSQKTRQRNHTLYNSIRIAWGTETKHSVNGKHALIKWRIL